MTNPILFKKRIQEILLQEYKVSFLGDNFNKIVIQINQEHENRIINWLEKIRKRELLPLKKTKIKKYKEYTTNELLPFRYPLNIAGIEYRIILVKVKNSIYIEFHLGKHKYYDSLSKELGLR